MKVLFFLLCVCTLFSFGNNNDSITGKWISPPSINGNVTSAEFKADNTFEAFLNNKAFASGTYNVKSDTLSFIDNGCDGARGHYKLIFFHSGDSLRFQPIQDSCTDRKEGMIRIIFGRDKNWSDETNYLLPFNDCSCNSHLFFLHA